MLSRNLVIIVVIALIPSHSFAQLFTPDWKMSCGPYGGDIDTVEQANDHAMYMITDLSTYFSSDQGVTWSDINPPKIGGIVSPDGAIWIDDTPTSHRWKPGSGWEAVTFPSIQQQPSTFLRTLPGDYAVFGGNLLEISTDDGKTWSWVPLNLPQYVDAQFSAVDFDGKGNAVGFVEVIPGNIQGYWYTSTDDGRTFTQGRPVAGVIYLGFGNDSILYIGYSDSRFPYVYESTDFGKTINPIIPSESYDFQVISGHPVMQEELTQSLTNHALKFSFDFGKNWCTTTYAYVENPTFVVEDTGTYLAYSRHTYIGELGYLYGLTVTRVSNFGTQFDTTVRSQAAGFMNTGETSGDGLLSWGNNLMRTTLGGLYTSSDNGFTWEPQTTLQPPFYLVNEAKFCVDSSGIFYVALNNDTTAAIFRSIDTGRTWQIHRMIGNVSSIRAALAVSHDTVFAAFDSAIYKTTDHGVSWATTAVVPWVFTELIANPKTGALICTKSPLVSSSTDSDHVSIDGGVTFSAVFREGRQMDILFADPSGNLWMMDSILYRSIDNEQHWAPVSTPILPYASMLLDRLGEIWMNQWNRFYVTGDFGASWDSCSTNNMLMAPIALTADGAMLALADLSQVPAPFPGDDQGTLYRAKIPVLSSSSIVRISDISNVQTLMCMPNPTANETFFDLPESETLSVSSVPIRIWNSAGQLVRTLIVPSVPRVSLSLSGLPSGAYRIEVLEKGEIRSGCVIVNR